MALFIKIQFQIKMKSLKNFDKNPSPSKRIGDSPLQKHAGKDGSVLTFAIKYKVRQKTSHILKSYYGNAVAVSHIAKVKF